MSLLKTMPLSQRLVASSNQLAGTSCRSMATVVDKIKEKAGAGPAARVTPVACTVGERRCCRPAGLPAGLACGCGRGGTEAA